jgi:hypothetical protein
MNDELEQLRRLWEMARDLFVAACRAPEISESEFNQRQAGYIAAQRKYHEALGY